MILCRSRLCFVNHMKYDRNHYILRKERAIMKVFVVFSPKNMKTRAGRAIKKTQTFR